jgi:hypothetical protein
MTITVIRFDNSNRFDFDRFLRAWRRGRGLSLAIETQVQGGPDLNNELTIFVDLGGAELDFFDYLRKVGFPFKIDR